jgi:hypothetical protein
MSEIWKDVFGYESKYQISNFGKVRSLIYGKKIILSPANINGYKQVGLSYKGKTNKFYVHRLVLIAFIENTENKKEVNHINGVKNDNRVSNLEWCTPKENMKHRNDVLGYKHSQQTKDKIALSLSKKR